MVADRTPRQRQPGRGATGATGKTGPPGAAGKQGPRGRRGRTGPAGPVHMTRDEFEAAVQSLNANLNNVTVQFQRMAQMQVELDELKREVTRLSNKKQP